MSEFEDSVRVDFFDIPVSCTISQAREIQLKIISSRNYRDWTIADKMLEFAIVSGQSTTAEVQRLAEREFELRMRLVSTVVVKLRGAPLARTTCRTCRPTCRTCARGRRRSRCRSSCEGPGTGTGQESLMQPPTTSVGDGPKPV